MTGVLSDADLARLAELDKAATEGMPDRGRRYGGAETIHNSGTVDIRVVDGRVTEVWFRCQQLAARVVEGETFTGGVRYYVDGAAVVAVELAP